MTRNRHTLAFGIGLVLMIAILVFWRRGEEVEQVSGVTVHEVSNRPIEVHADGYIGSDSCRECHQHQYETWHSSYHHSMTQIATPEAVVGRFDDQEFVYNGRKYMFYRSGDEFRVKTDNLMDSEEPLDDRPVVMTTGSHHFQTYWLPTGNGRALELVPLIFRIEDGIWLPLASQFLHPPDHEHHFVGQQGGWNRTCNRCHATHARPRIRSHGDMDTHVAEFGISCEACHGPAERHVENVRLDRNDLAIVQPARLSADRSAQVCAGCHSVSRLKTEADREHWMQFGYRFRPGEDLSQYRRFVRTGDQQFWPDGMLRVSGREYMGLLTSPCFQHDDASRKITCLSCHQMHQRQDDPRQIHEWANDQLKPDMDSNRPNQRNNQACIQCHGRFSTDEELSQHTRHSASSSGSLCYNCHMPHTSWGMMKALRSHTISSPNVVESLHPVRRPNACNLCHLDKTLDWTAKKLNQLYHQPVPELSTLEKTVAASLLWSLKGDAGQRALVARSMGWEPARTISGSDWMTPTLAHLLEDPYPVVRNAAYIALTKADPYRSLNYNFLGPAEEHTAARQHVMQVWGTLDRSADSAANSATLIDRNGHLLTDLFERILKQRDDRPVHLKE